MSKEVATVNFNFDLEVVKTKALVDEWKGAALTWWSVDGKLCSKLFKAYEALGGGEGPGAYRSKVQSGTSKVQSCTLKDFYEAIGMKKRTFYNFINRTKSLIEAGADIENMSGSMKAIADMTGKTEKEIELEESVALLEEEVQGRQEAVDEAKENIRQEKDRVEAAVLELEDLKEKMKEDSEPSPALVNRIAELEKQEKKLSEEVDWLSTSASFKNEVRVFINSATDATKLGKRLIAQKRR